MTDINRMTLDELVAMYHEELDFGDPRHQDVITAVARLRGCDLLEAEEWLEDDHQ